LLPGLRSSRITAPCVFDGAINGERSRASVQQMLATAKFKAALHKAVERTREGLWRPIDQNTRTLRFQRMSQLLQKRQL
jgi:hypothetical protein